MIAASCLHRVPHSAQACFDRGANAAGKAGLRSGALQPVAGFDPRFVEWVRTHDSAKFLESFYFQYGHASIADLGHSRSASKASRNWPRPRSKMSSSGTARARSSRYQDFSQAERHRPPECTPPKRNLYCILPKRSSTRIAKCNGERSQAISRRAVFPSLRHEARSLSPQSAARAFDIARYLLPFGIPTGVGQVTSIRTLEKQVRRLKACEFQELRELEKSSPGPAPAAAVRLGSDAPGTDGAHARAACRSR